MTKIYICSDKNDKSKKIKEKIKKKLTLTNIKKCKFILVIGGDGFMLEKIRVGFALPCRLIWGLVAIMCRLF